MKVYIQTWSNGAVTISALDDRGVGHGYRLIGPKFRDCPAGNEPVARHELTQRDASEIRGYLDRIEEETP